MKYARILRFHEKANPEPVSLGIQGGDAFHEKWIRSIFLIKSYETFPKSRERIAHTDMRLTEHQTRTENNLTSL